MKAINRKAKKIMDKIVAMIPDGVGEDVKIENEATFMPVVAERIDTDVYSICQYSSQNGDLMCDPEMTFLHAGGEYYPISFRNDYIGKHEISAIVANGQVMKEWPRQQRDHVAFAGLWMDNIKSQQRL